MMTAARAIGGREYDRRTRKPSSARVGGGVTWLALWLAMVAVVVFCSHPSSGFGVVGPSRKQSSSSSSRTSLGMERPYGLSPRYSQPSSDAAAASIVSLRMVAKDEMTSSSETAAGASATGEEAGESADVVVLDDVSVVDTEEEEEEYEDDETVYEFMPGLVDAAAEKAGASHFGLLSKNGKSKSKSISMRAEVAAPTGRVTASSSAAAGGEEEEGEDAEAQMHSHFMMQAVELARQRVGERDNYAPFPRPPSAALLVSNDGRVMGKGVSTCNDDCVTLAFADAGLDATPLREWCVAWPSERRLRQDVSESTLYVTLEPSSERRGQSLPPITKLIEAAGVPRVVIGCQHPVPERATEGAGRLHAAGISVTMGTEQEACEELIEEYAGLANAKLLRFARNHLKQHGRPLGFLHCSVIDSVDAKAFARNGNAFGKAFGGHVLSERAFGAYELAPPPESIWAAGESEGDGDEESDYISPEFEDEDEQEALGRSPMMPWYQQVDAVVATFPHAGNGPSDDDSVMSRLNGLKWLATHGKGLPAGVERILVMDATDLADLPLQNDDPSLPTGVDVEEFWRAEGRKPTRVLLRHASNAIAEAAARAAAKAAEAAAEAARLAKAAIESGEAEAAAESAIECQKAAVSSMQFIQRDVEEMQDLKSALSKLGVVVETIKGGEPIDVMTHLGKRNGYKAVVWRAGCWGGRGVEAILKGAFQWVSAHLAVDAVGGKFWQLMLGERAVQAACGPESKVKVFAEQEDFSLEYCDNELADQDCALTVAGRPIRHVRIDCRVALVDDTRPRELKGPRVKAMKRSLTEEAPWFL